MAWLEDQRQILYALPEIRDDLLIRYEGLIKAGYDIGNFPCFETMCGLKSITEVAAFVRSHGYCLTVDISPTHEEHVVPAVKHLIKSVVDNNEQPFCAYRTDRGDEDILCVKRSKALGGLLPWIFMQQMLQLPDCAAPPPPGMDMGKYSKYSFEWHAPGEYPMTMLQKRFIEVLEVSDENEIDVFYSLRGPLADSAPGPSVQQSWKGPSKPTAFTIALIVIKKRS